MDQSLQVRAIRDSLDIWMSEIALVLRTLFTRACWRQGQELSFCKSIAAHGRSNNTSTNGCKMHLKQPTVHTDMTTSSRVRLSSDEALSVGGTGQ